MIISLWAPKALLSLSLSLRPWIKDWIQQHIASPSVGARISLRFLLPLTVWLERREEGKKLCWGLNAKPKLCTISTPLSLVCKLGSSLRGETKKESSREHIKKRKSKSPIHFSHLHTHSLSLILAGVRIQIPILCFCFGFGCALVASLSTKFVNEEEEKKKERKKSFIGKRKIVWKKNIGKIDSRTHANRRLRPLDGVREFSH